MTALYINEDINKAIEILMAEGCTEIYIFGSFAEDISNDKSDIDIAVRGLVPGKYFSTMGRLMVALDRECDLLDLDDVDNRFAKMMLEKGTMIRVA